MLIKSGKIVLDKDDINKIIKYKLDQLTDALSDNYDDIVDGTFDKDSISVFKGNTSDDEHVANSMESVFREYITDLKDKPETHHSVIKQINRIIDTNMTLIQEVKSVKTSQKTLFNALKGVDKYTADMIECEHDDKTMDKWIHPMVNACLKSPSGKNNAQRSTNTIKTPWEDVFKEYALTKKRQSVRKLSDNTIIQNKTSIYTCFQMIQNHPSELILPTFRAELLLISVEPVCSNHRDDRICFVKTSVSILLKPFFDDQYLDELPPLKRLPVIQ